MIALYLLLAAARFETSASAPFILLRDNEAKLEAAIAPEKGGELASLVLDRVELIYLGRDYSARSGFNGKAMFLWPATGPVKTMPFHGFAKDQPWQVVEHQADAKAAWAVLRLTDNAHSRQWYPHAFTLTVRYTLDENGLAIAYTVEAGAKNTQPMPFAIGNHVAFNLPLTPKGQAGKVTFTSSCQDEIVRDQQSLPTGEIRRWRHATDTVALADINAIPAISLANCGRNARVRLADPSGLAIEINHRADSLPKMPVVQYNLYGKASDGFFSPEPWVGLQGSHDRNQGLTRLAPGGRWRWIITIKPATKP